MKKLHFRTNKMQKWSNTLCSRFHTNNVDMLYIYKQNSAQLLLPTSCCLSIWPPEGLLHHLRAFTVKQSCAERGLLQAFCGKARHVLHTACALEVKAISCSQCSSCFASWQIFVFTLNKPKAHRFQLFCHTAISTESEDITKEKETEERGAGRFILEEKMIIGSASSLFLCVSSTISLLCHFGF